MQLEDNSGKPNTSEIRSPLLLGREALREHHHEVRGLEQVQDDRPYLQAQGVQVLAKKWSLHMFGQYAGGVICTGDLLEAEVLGPEAIVGQEILGRQMAKSPNTSSAASAHCCARVSPNGQVPVEAEALRDRDKAQQTAGAFADAPELGLSTGEGDV